jgi:endonuclease/exonuclease/phosphatase family metal-dependent hydrolase
MNDYAPIRTRSARWPIAILIVFCAVGLVAWEGAKRKRPEPRSGQALRQPAGLTTQPTTRAAAAANQPARFRIAMYNVYAGRGTDGKRLPYRAADLLHSFDFIGINEAKGRLFRKDQIEVLGEKLAMPHLFAASERRWWHDDFGNGFLSRLPIEFWSITPLPRQRDGGFRNVVHARVRLDEETALNVLITHLDRHSDRQSQLRHVIELFKSMQEPAVLMGDLNTRYGNDDDGSLRALLNTSGVVDPIGDTPQAPEKERIDWIITRGLKMIDGGAVMSAASDHPMVWAELERPAQLPLQPPPLERATYTTRPATTRASD